MSFIVFDYFCPKCHLKAHDCYIRGCHLNTQAEKDATKCPDCNTQMIRLPAAPCWKWTAGSRGF